MAERDWWARPVRIVQFNLQVKDAPRTDPQAVMDAVVDLNCNVVAVNAGGIHAWYPTEVEFHTPNTFMEGRDIFGDCVAAAHERGLKVLGRVDFSKAEDRAFQAHPEWFTRTHDGEPNIIGKPRPGEWSLMYEACLMGAYRNDAVALPVLEELCRRYEVDGVFVNAPGFPICYCGNCRTAFTREARRRPPEEFDWDDADFREWVEWRYDRMAANFRRMMETVKKARPEAIWVAELAGPTSEDPWRSGMDLVRLWRHSDVLMTSSGSGQASGRQPVWIPAINAKLAREVAGGAPPWATVQCNPGLPWRHTTRPPADLSLGMAQVNANGAMAWNSLTGIPDTRLDSRGYPVLRDFAKFIKEHEQYFDGASHEPPVALLWSQQSLERRGRGDPERWLHEFFGFCDALTYRGAPFTVIPDQYVDAVHLGRWKALVLPSAACMRDSQIGAIAKFVANGGGVVASFMTGMCDENGESRPQWLLTDIVDAVYEGHVFGREPAAYMRVEDTDSPLVAGLGETQITQMEEGYALVRPRDRAQSLLTLAPRFATREGSGTPPERATLPSFSTSIPLAVQAKGGRVIYFATEIGRLNWKYQMPDHSLLIANAVRMAAGGSYPVEVKAPFGVQMSYFRQPGRLIVHLVNGLADRPRVDVVPVADVSVGVEFGAGPPPASAKALALGRELKTITAEGLAWVTLPRLDTWEALVFELGD